MKRTVSYKPERKQPESGVTLCSAHLNQYSSEEGSSTEFVVESPDREQVARICALWPTVAGANLIKDVAHCVERWDTHYYAEQQDLEEAATQKAVRQQLRDMPTLNTGLLAQAQHYVEVLINSTPTSELRNELTEINMRLLSLYNEIWAGSSVKGKAGR